jgi:putative hydrolase of the HAD superfamily
MPDEVAANEAIVATAQVAKQWHSIPPGDLKDSVRRTARRIRNAHPVVAPYNGSFDVSSWEALSSSFEGDDDEMRQLHKWAPDYRREVWNQALCECGLCDPLLADRLSVLYPLERRARYKPFPDVIPVLTELRREFALGLVTNGPRDLQWEKTERAGLKDCFAAIVISREVGVMKPDPRIFAIALERLGVAPAEAIFVGDTPRTDIVGAHAAGMKAVWLNRERLALPDGIEPDAEIRELLELRPALERLR